MTAPRAGAWPACYDYFFSRLRDVIECRGKVGAFKAKCPAHDDKIQSLSVRVGAKGQLYVRCHAGGLCSVVKIVEACGCVMDDLFPDNKRHTKSERESAMSRQPIAYQYRDEANNLLFEAVRFEPKKFMQRRPNPAFNATLPPDRDTNPEYLYNLEGVRRVLYNLPHLIAAMKKTPDKMVLVVEGEKDVETARAAGILATTNPMGAGKWLPEFAESLRGANVVVIPDNDEPGKVHAKAVCDSLKDAARSVRYLELPGLAEKEDFSDWWGRQTGTVDERKVTLRNMVNALKLVGGTKTVEAGEPPKAKPSDTPGLFGVSEADAMKAEQEANKAAADAEAKVATASAPEPTSPTIRGADGLPNPDPRILPPGDPMLKSPAPVPVPVVEPAAKVDAKPPAAKVAAVPADRAARVADFIKDVKKTATGLSMAGVKLSNHLELYAAVHIGFKQMQDMYSLSNGAPKLDAAGLGSWALTMGAYLFLAAAEMGTGVGLLVDEKEPSK